MSTAIDTRAPAISSLAGATARPYAANDRHHIARPRRRGAVWTGRVLSGLATAFLLADAGGKLIQARPYVEGTVNAGYPASAVVPIGVILLACLVVHLIPRTAVLGAVLLTGYFGGAVATHFRLGDPLLTHTLFPIFFAAIVWGGLYLRDGRVRALYLIGK